MHPFTNKLQYFKFIYIYYEHVLISKKYASIWHTFIHRASIYSSSKGIHLSRQHVVMLPSTKYSSIYETCMYSKVCTYSSSMDSFRKHPSINSSRIHVAYPFVHHLSIISIYPLHRFQFIKHTSTHKTYCHPLRIHQSTKRYFHSFID